jgi:hypothetical protein
VGKKLVRTPDQRKLRGTTDMAKAKSSKGLKFLREHLLLLSWGDMKSSRRMGWAKEVVVAGGHCDAGVNVSNQITNLVFI